MLWSIFLFLQGKAVYVILRYFHKRWRRMMKEKKNTKFYLALVIFSLVGQVAWVVENMYFNVFIF